VDVVRYLHHSGATLNARDNEPLCRAAQGGHLDVVRYLHWHGVELHARNDEALSLACAAGHLEVVRYLHENGVAHCVRDKDGHNEPLRRAAAGGHLQVVCYLHVRGAASHLLTAEALRSIKEMRQELDAAPVITHLSKFWKELNKINERFPGGAKQISSAPSTRTTSTSSPRLPTTPT
jgi:hypothetical protein